MYKVFINEIPFFFTDKHTVLEGFETVVFKELNSQFFFYETPPNPKAKINVICENVQEDWCKFLENFEIREAAGGVVKNNRNEMLWIYRFDTWDLPKGHIEKGESKQVAAIREVEEECNVTGLKIEEELTTTYHVFQHKGKQIMKVTYWFLMHTVDNNSDLIPQTEEGITEVCFKNKKESLDCLSNTYENIKLLLQQVL